MRLAKCEGLLERRSDSFGVERANATSARSGKSFTREFGRFLGIVYAWSFSAMCVSIG
jgi:hypothetical protein